MPTESRESNPESQRARRAAGWRWLKIIAPQEVYMRVGQIASTYKLSRETVTLQATRNGLAWTPLNDWGRLGRAVPLRMRRRDGGLCLMCRQRLREKREKAQLPS